MSPLDHWMLQFKMEFLQHAISEAEDAMTSKDDLLREGRELLKKGQELLDKAEALSKPEPVTACVGDRVHVTWLTSNLTITTPQYGPRCSALDNNSQHWSPHLDSIHTLDGRKIDRVVPFRIRKSLDGDWHVVGDPSWARAGERGELATAKDNAVTMTRYLWPWYDGPAYVVEE